MKISKNIKEYELKEGVSLSTYPIKNSKLITICGSFEGGKIHSPYENPFISNFCALMLKRGTKNMDRIKIAEKLESLGVYIAFSSSPKFTKFIIKTRKETAFSVLKLLKELLYKPTFPNNQLEILKKNIIDKIEQEKEDTRLRANNAFRRALFKKRHPNYVYSAKERIEYIKKINTKELKNFHKKYYKSSKINLSAVGAIDKKLIDEIRNVFPKVKQNKQKRKEDYINFVKNITKEEKINIPEKDNADVFTGRSLPFPKNNKDYLATLLAVSVLGNGFTARLMKNVRDKKGLTYGTTSRLRGFDDGVSGFWFAFGMFAPSLLNKGIEAINEEIKLIYQKGITENELKNQKNHILGNYKLSLSNTEGLANKILDTKENGWDIEEIDNFIDKLKAVSKKEVKKVLKKYFNPKNLSISTAGTLK